MKLQVNIIGAGRLGKNLALALINAGLIRLNAICNRNYASAKLAAKQIGAGEAVNSLTKLPFADLTFIVTPDDQISLLAQQLAQQNKIAADTVIVHCSGALSSQELQPLQKIGCHVASLHPLKAFTTGEPGENAFKNCDCIIEGDQKAITILHSLFTCLQAKITSLKTEAKITYHLAAVFAANYLVSLAAISKELMQEVGIQKDLAQQMICRLMESSLANIQKVEEPVNAFTGPIVRGDFNTISKHLQVLQDKPLIKSLYQAAALASLSMMPLSENDKTALNCLLT